MKRSCNVVIGTIICWVLTGGLAWGGFKFELHDQVKGEIGFWAQAWYQYVEDGNDSNGDGVLDDGLNDFLLRRAYLNIGGEVTQFFLFFTHIATDRIGQDGLNDSSLGLGSGVAFRDLWITLQPWEELKLQVGRMYVPFTRNYGTTSTKSLLTTDLDWVQGGVRGTIFYPSKVGRDDGATLWGNIMGGLFQYRLMVAEGVESSIVKPDDSLRFAGRISVSLFEPETGWFNQGTYLGTKRVLSLGLGGDFQEDLVFGLREDDYTGWTVDLFYDQPVGGGALTVEAAYIDIDNGPNRLTYTQFATGDSGSIISLKGGYLLPGEIGIGRLQFFGHYEYVNVDESGKDNTQIYGLGLNYYIKGHANKLSLDLTWVDQKDEVATAALDAQDHFLLTLQLAAGF